MRVKGLQRWWLMGFGCRTAGFLLAVAVGTFLLTSTSQAGSPHLQPLGGGRSFLGPPVGLQNLTNGQSLVVGDKVFSGFQIIGDIPASEVTVSPTQDSFGYGIRFSGGFAALENETKDMLIGYTVTVVTNSPYLISDAHLRFDGTVIGAGLAAVTEQVSTLSFALIGQTAVAATNRLPTVNELESTLEIDPPQPGLVISKDVLITVRPGGYAWITGIDQTFSEVLIPEPATLALSTFALTMLGLLRRRFGCRR